MLSKIIHLAFFVFLFAATTMLAQQEKLPTCTITFIDEYKAEVKLTVELATSNKQRTYGLMKRETLGEDEGMLFVHPKEQYLSYWMKNVTLPLSIAYVDNKAIIRDIQKMKPLDTNLVYLSPVPVRYAIEVNQGWFEKNKIKVGSRVVFNGCLSQ